MPALDLKKALGTLYRPPRTGIAEVDVPALRYLMVDGQGNPNTSTAYAEAVEALFSVAYAARFRLKAAPGGLDVAVMPLEGLWWADDPRAFTVGDRARWKWTMMILQPDVVSDVLLDEAIAHVRARKALPGLDRLRVEAFCEGRCAQLLHIGPFSEEGPAIERLHAHIEARSALRGKHHEIYLSDTRRTDTRRWKTILRQPMA